ncbi:hypothetical protein MMYC01_203322 [Madurella mycetomatis]|uniref:C2H2-type domain-containing protein n=1 Tax=Madurella mycetomatis TaxID=100816 RepID=A0A175W7V8_9PEZI|nr:hypothetical protein MMYC01_203322 [Madurella mycetomatis]
MERSAAEYAQSGLPSPYPSNVGDTQSEASSIDHASAAPYAAQQEVRSGNYSASATPASDYSAYPPSSRSSSFPEHVQRTYHAASNHSGSSADPSIAAASPTYPHGQYSPYAAPPQDMSHGYHPGGSLYPQTRPDWGTYTGSPAAPITPSHHVFPQTPTSATPQARPNQVYSFVPIPGAQQHKRPRRRYEEIERMYKCGWNGCEKAYGTLNHLNAHVTMQAHGQKRTPEEFKEIRKEWKARKKEEEAARKAEEERQRQAAATAAAQNGGTEGQTAADGSQPPTTYAGARNVQLPPIAYQTTQYSAPPSAGIQSMSDYSYPNYSPASPYAQTNQQMYGQHNGNQPSH